MSAKKLSGRQLNSEVVFEYFNKFILINNVMEYLGVLSRFDLAN